MIDFLTKQTGCSVFLNERLFHWGMDSAVPSSSSSGMALVKLTSSSFSFCLAASGLINVFLSKVIYSSKNLSFRLTFGW